MPILAAEPEVYPAGLLDQPAEAGGERWWVLHTRPRQEKALARRLRALGVPNFLPTYGQRVRVGGGVRTARIPLFTGYVFLFAHREQRVAALATNRVVRAIEVVDQVEIHRDLRQIHRLMTAGLPLVPEINVISGMPVEVISGPLTGVRGTIVRRTTGRHLLVKVNFIQQGASVEIEDFALMPIGPAARRLTDGEAKLCTV